MQSQESDYSDIKESITVPAGYSEFKSEFEMRHRVLSYALKLNNNRTGEEKKIAGKLILETPTGNYNVIRVD